MITPLKKKEIALLNYQNNLLTWVIHWYSHFMRFGPPLLIHDSKGGNYRYTLMSHFVLEYYQFNIDQFIYNHIVNVRAINQFLNWQFKWININSLTVIKNWISYLLWSIPPQSYITIPKCKSLSCDAQHYLTYKSKTVKIFFGSLYPLRIKTDSHITI